MRSFKLTLLLALLMVAVAPAPARAWFEFLDYLSGPGKFYGERLDFRVWCFGDDSTGKQILEAERLFTTAFAHSLVGGTPDNLETVKSSWKDLATKLTEINTSFHVLDDARMVTLAHNAQALQAADLATFRAAYNRAASNDAKVLAGDTSAGPAGNSVTGVINTSLQLLRDTYRAAASIASTGIFVSFCSPYKTRTFAVEVGAAFLQANSKPEYARDYTIRLNTFTGAISYRLSATPKYDFVDAGLIGGGYRFSSRGFDDPIWRVMLEPFVDIHGPTHCLNQDACRKLKFLSLLTLRAGMVWFPQGFDTAKFAAVPAKLGHISGRESTLSATIYFNLTPLLRHPALIH